METQFFFYKNKYTQMKYVLKFMSLFIQFIEGNGMEVNLWISPQVLSLPFFQFVFPIVNIEKEREFIVDNTNELTSYALLIVLLESLLECHQKGSSENVPQYCTRNQIFKKL